jgi:sialic acid synthase SpsE
MQCNTDYTSPDRVPANISVISTYDYDFPGIVILGLSDHTKDSVTVIGAVALGARVIEKHFTDDIHREGPDHSFAIDPFHWRLMVNEVRELEYALGDGIKCVQENELESHVIQRRAVRAARFIPNGKILERDDLICLRPCPLDALPPYRLQWAIGAKVTEDIEEGDYLSDSKISGR